MLVMGEMRYRESELKFSGGREKSKAFDAAEREVSLLAHARFNRPGAASQNASFPGPPPIFN
jgi:hypothetical protein